MGKLAMVLDGRRAFVFCGFISGCLSPLHCFHSFAFVPVTLFTTLFPSHSLFNLLEMYRLQTLFNAVRCIRVTLTETIQVEINALFLLLLLLLLVVSVPSVVVG